MTLHRSSRVIALLIVLALAALALTGCGTTESTAQSNTAAHDALKTSIMNDRLQAVILTNDRVYFGHLKALGNGWYSLSKAFFIRQVADGKGQTASQKVTPLGLELQQPDSTVLLNRDNIVQVENLTANSVVATAIKNYVPSAAGSVASAATPTAPTGTTAPAGSTAPTGSTAPAGAAGTQGASGGTTAPGAAGSATPGAGAGAATATGR